MKILLTNEACNMGGVETLMLALAAILRSYGHQCELFFFNHGPLEQYLPADCAAHFGSLADCLKLVDAQGFDVVHANSTDWHVGISAVSGTRARLVLTSHGRSVPTWNSTNCDALASCCQWEGDEQQAFTDLKIRYVPNGIDTDRFRPDEKAAPSSPPIVAWVGRGNDLTQKRIDKLALIAPALREAGVRLWLVEPYGPEEVAKVSPESAHALLSTADFWGAVPLAKMPAFFQEVAASCGCLISTSSFEGLPLTLLEAQACGCPVIGPDVRGVNECVDPEHGGLLYPFEMESGQLAALVLDTLSDTKKMEWRREACVRYARERFCLQRMAQDYLSVYQETLQQKRRTPLAGARNWLQLTRALGWRGYLEHCWLAGHRQYEASRELAERGELDLALLAARSALATCPSLYARPARLSHLLRIGMRQRFSSRRLRKEEGMLKTRVEAAASHMGKRHE